MPFLRPIILISLMVLAGCAAPADGNRQNRAYAMPERTDADRLWPGDELTIRVPSAPELSRRVTLSPKETFDFPPIGLVDVAGRDLRTLDEHLERALSDELIDPRVEINQVGAAPQRVFVGGSVGRPGAIKLPGDIGPLEAIIMAGDFRTDLRQRDVMLIRRSDTGTLDTWTYNLRNGLADDAFASWGPLQPYDIIYVSPDRITGADRVLGHRLRGILPIDFAIFFGIS
ncbi:MAG: polysaccharide biosynthesis/export family protein [Pseudomonadota bacterium]